MPEVVVYHRMPLGRTGVTSDRLLCALRCCAESISGVVIDLADPRSRPALVQGSSEGVPERIYLPVPGGHWPAQ